VGVLDRWLAWNLELAAMPAGSEPELHGAVEATLEARLGADETAAFILMLVISAGCSGDRSTTTLHAVSMARNV